MCSVSLRHTPQVIRDHLSSRNLLLCACTRELLEHLREARERLAYTYDARMLPFLGVWCLIAYPIKPRKVSF